MYIALILNKHLTSWIQRKKIYPQKYFQYCSHKVPARIRHKDQYTTNEESLLETYFCYSLNIRFKPERWRLFKMYISTFCHGRVTDKASFCQSFPYFAKVELWVAEKKNWIHGKLIGICHKLSYWQNAGTFMAFSLHSLTRYH